ncbi:MAG: ABC transporter ATP-binding protein [Acidimicrobiia bacterium]|nr:ABC transporter ATP-binding protein [Acidimicrobiia bacterium]
MSTQHLIADNVWKSFGHDEALTPVLHGIDLSIDQGDFVAIMGPSGSGKSTLLYCVSGMDDVSDGTVTLSPAGSEAVEITALPQRDLAALRLNRMGFVFQQVHLLRNLTILDNVVLPGVTATPDRRADVVDRALQLLERVGIAELSDRDITQASGGQLQRAAIARALINEPELVFGDEPTGALNAATAAEIMELLAEVNAEGRTVVLVTHDPVVAAYCRRVVVLRDGVIDGDLRRTDGETDESWADNLAGWLISHGT